MNGTYSWNPPVVAPVFSVIVALCCSLYVLSFSTSNRSMLSMFLYEFMVSPVPAEFDDCSRMSDIAGVDPFACLSLTSSILTRSSTFAFDTKTNWPFALI